MSILSVLGPLSLIVAQVVMALLSKRLGEVTKRPPTYRWFYLGAGLVGVSILLQVVDILSGLERVASLLYDALFLLGLAVSVVVAWSYWSWLLSESRNKA